MVAAVRVHKTGGPEVMVYEQIELAAPGPGQIKIKQHAIGVNYIDTYFRMGMYPAPGGLPFVVGSEGAGEVIAVGSGVTDFKVGDRVAAVVAMGGVRKSEAPAIAVAAGQPLRAGGRLMLGQRNILRRTLW